MLACASSALAQFAAGNKGAAATAHNDAIKAHVNLVTGSPAPAAYVTAQASETAGSITLEKILTHKYVSGFSMIEPYNDWRRTGVPSLSPSPLALISIMGLGRPNTCPLAKLSTPANAYAAATPGSAALAAALP